MNNLFWPTLYVKNHIPKTAKLSSSARTLLDVFLVFMRAEDNLISFSEGGMDFYLQYCNETLNINYSEKTVRNAISELNHKDLLLKSRNNIYYINPLYFFKLHDKINHKELIEETQKRTGANLIDNNMKVVLIKKKVDQESELNQDKPLF